MCALFTHWIDPKKRSLSIACLIDNYEHYMWPFLLADDRCRRWTAIITFGNGLYSILLWYDLSERDLALLVLRAYMPWRCHCKTQIKCKRTHITRQPCGTKKSPRGPRSLVWNLAETGWKALFRLNYCERKTLFRLKKEVEQVEFGISRTVPTRLLTSL